MPYPWNGLLGVLLFVAGLAGLLWRRSAPRRALCAVLMINGVLLLFIAASAWLRQPEGQAMALVVLGILPAYLLWVR